MPSFSTLMARSAPHPNNSIIQSQLTPPPLPIQTHENAKKKQDTMSFYQCCAAYVVSITLFLSLSQ
jgi:hypothetical protein